ncbi:hypothetical protein Tco_0566496 [Tanacetum coccineum]
MKTWDHKDSASNPQDESVEAQGRIKNYLAEMQTKVEKRKGKAKSTNGGQFTGPSVKQNVRYEPKATTSAPKKGVTNVGNTSQSSSMLKTTVNSSKKDNLSMSNSFSALNYEEEDDEEDVENGLKMSKMESSIAGVQVPGQHWHQSRLRDRRRKGRGIPMKPIKSKLLKRKEKSGLCRDLVFWAGKQRDARFQGERNQD